MAVLTASLFAVFGEFRGGSTRDYSAVFADASSLEGRRLGPGRGRTGRHRRQVTLRDDNTVLVSFDADDDVVLTTGTRAAVRYLNLVGDRYLELARRSQDRPG